MVIVTEGSPAFNTPPVGTAGGHAAAEPVRELVLVYAMGVPPQLEHWLKKRHLRLHVNEKMSLDANEVRSMQARYVFIDLDYLPEGREATEVLRTLKSQVPDVKLMVMTHRTSSDFVHSLTEAGALSVVIKQPYVADLVFSLQAAQEGRSYVSGVATEREKAAVQITAREREVLELMANGHSNQSIGERLGISVKTVEAHRARLFKKLGASNVADAVLLAIRTGLVMP